MRGHSRLPESRRWLLGVALAVTCFLPRASVRAEGRDANEIAEDVAETQPVIFGPIPLRSLAGLSLIFYQPAAERAATLARGRWRLSTNFNYAAIEDDGGNDDASVNLDGEILGWEVRADYGVTDRVEVSLTIPTYYTTGGFLDGVIEGFHDLTGLGRSSEEHRNQWNQEIVVDGKTLFDPGGNEFGLADIAVQLKGGILTEGKYPLGLSARVGLELPTGRESRDFGSGGFDLGLGLLVEKNFARIGLFGGFDYLLYQRPSDFRRAGASLEDFLYATSWGAEYRPGDWWAIHAQVDVLGNFIRGTGVSQLDEAQIIGSLGLSFAISDHLRWRLAVSEDFSLAATADIAFFSGLSWEIP